MASSEIWRSVPGFENRYEVSDFGRVRTWLKNGPGHVLLSVPKLIKPRPDKDGYLRVNLKNIDRGYSYFRINRLVLLAFKGEPPSSQHQACHNDGSRDNNTLFNLRWDTPVQNQADRLIHGTDVRGTKQPTSKLTSDQVLEIRRRVAAGEKQRNVAAIFHVSQMQIFRIVHKHSWSWL
jgi:hypothetical protein